MKNDHEILDAMADAEFWDFMRWTERVAERFRGRDFTDMISEWELIQWLFSEVNFN